MDLELQQQALAGRMAGRSGSSMQERRQQRQQAAAVAEKAKEPELSM